MRIAAARAVDGNEIYAVNARFEANPRFYRKEHIDAYGAAIAEGMRRLEREVPRPTGIETRVARAVVATRGTEGHGLALAMAEALGFGTTDTADGILKERAAVLAELQRDAPAGESPDGRSLRETRLARRVHASFTGAEVRDMCEGKGPVMEWLPGAAARTRVREAMLGLHRETWSWDPSPWRARHDGIARSLGGAERRQGPERDRGIYPEIEPW